MKKNGINPGTFHWLWLSEARANLSQHGESPANLGKIKDGCPGLYVLNPSDIIAVPSPRP